MVTEIKNIKIIGDGMEWMLHTTKGDMKFVTINRKDVISGDGYVILINEFDMPLRIYMKNLDRRSVSLLEKSV